MLKWFDLEFENYKKNVELSFFKKSKKNKFPSKNVFWNIASINDFCVKFSKFEWNIQCKWIQW